jgi:hypothetical protein
MVTGDDPRTGGDVLSLYEQALRVLDTPSEITYPAGPLSLRFNLGTGVTLLSDQPDSEDDPSAWCTFHVEHIPILIERLRLFQQLYLIANRIVAPLPDRLVSGG